jgi:uncharacterized protein YidB (DUF937 family)
MASIFNPPGGVMSLFDQLSGVLVGLSGNSNQNSAVLVNGLIQLLGTGSQGKGLAGLVQGFQQNGMGDIISSWIGTGENLPVSSEQVQASLGDQLQQFASTTGLSTEAASTQLAQILPLIIDKLTPNGQLPEGDVQSSLLEQGLNFFKAKI